MRQINTLTQQMVEQLVQKWVLEGTETLTILFFFFLSFIFLRAVLTAYGGSQARGLTAYATATGTPYPCHATSVTYTTAQGNDGSLTH